MAGNDEGDTSKLLFSKLETFMMHLTKQKKEGITPVSLREQVGTADRKEVERLVSGMAEELCLRGGADYDKAAKLKERMLHSLDSKDYARLEKDWKAFLDLYAGMLRRKDQARIDALLKRYDTSLAELEKKSGPLHAEELELLSKLSEAPAEEKRAVRRRSSLISLLSQPLTAFGFLAQNPAEVASHEILGHALSDYLLSGKTGQVDLKDSGFYHVGSKYTYTYLSGYAPGTGQYVERSFDAPQLTWLGRLLGQRVVVESSQPPGTIAHYDINGEKYDLYNSKLETRKYNAYYAMIAAGSVSDNLLSLPLLYAAFKLRKNHPLASSYLAGVSLRYWASSIYYPLTGGSDWTQLQRAGFDPKIAAGIFAMTLPTFAAYLYYKARKAEKRVQAQAAFTSLVDKGAITKEEVGQVWRSYERRDRIAGLFAGAADLLKKEERGRLDEWRLARVLKKLDREDERYLNRLADYFREELKPELEHLQRMGKIKRGFLGILLEQMPWRKPSPDREHIESILVDGQGNSLGVGLERNLIAITDSEGNAVRFRKDGKVDYIFSKGWRLFYEESGEIKYIKTPTGKKLAERSGDYGSERKRLEALVAGFEEIRSGATKVKIDGLFAEAVGRRVRDIKGELEALAGRKESAVDVLPFKHAISIAEELIRQKDYARAEKLIELAAKLVNDPYIFEFLVFSKKMGGRAPPRGPSLGELDERGMEDVFAEAEKSRKGFLSMLSAVDSELAEAGRAQEKAGDLKTASCIANIITALRTDKEFNARFDAYLRSKAEKAA